MRLRAAEALRWRTQKGAASVEEQPVVDRQTLAGVPTCRLGMTHFARGPWCLIQG